MDVTGYGAVSRAVLHLGPDGGDVHQRRRGPQPGMGRTRLPLHRAAATMGRDLASAPPLRLSPTGEWDFRTLQLPPGDAGDEGGGVARIDYDHVADRYHAGRAVALDRLDGWRQAIQPYVDNATSPSSTSAPVRASGRRHSHSWFALPVVAVEPSAGMRAGRRPARASPRSGPGRRPSRGPPLSLLIDLFRLDFHRHPPCGGCPRMRPRAGPGAHARRRRPHPQLVPRSPRGDRVVQYFPAAKRVAETFPTVEELTRCLRRAPSSDGRSSGSGSRGRPPCAPSVTWWSTCDKATPLWRR